MICLKVIIQIISKLLAVVMTADPFVDRAKTYALDITTGEIPANTFVKLACQRFLNDLKRTDITLYPTPGKRSPGSKWCSFLEKLPHVKGKWARTGQLLVLSDWQVFCVVNIYGWHYVDTGLRRFNEAYICVGRKNGKTFLIAGLGLGHLVIDNEFGAEVYCGASTKSQAMEVFSPARLMLKYKEKISKHFGVTVNKTSLSKLSDNSLFQPVIGKPGDGASPSCAIVDEFHEHDTSDQYDTFKTGMAARENPMTLIITTAGYNMAGPCYDKQLEVQSILTGAVEDDNIFGIIYGIDEDDNWDSLEALKKANPNYGISVFPRYLEGELKAARRSPSKQVSFKTKHANMWVGAKAAWMNMLAYQACRRKDAELEQFKGREAIIGLDLASKTDIADMGVLIMPSEADPLCHYFCKHYLPEEKVTDGENLKYKEWHANGWLTTTPGNVTDFAYIENDLKDAVKMFTVKEIPFDPFQATQFSTRMIELGLPMIEVGQTVKNFSEPMKETEAMILRKDIRFSFDPVLMWMMGNVTARMDMKQNIFPNKEREENKIDGVVSLIMCVNRVIWYRDNTRESIYTKMAREKKQNEN
jgi:phage terminase large subunit-like protein